MLYLTSLSKEKLIPDNTIKLLIARVPIKNMNEYKIHHVPQMAPSFALLGDIKQKNIDWREYVVRFRKELIIIESQIALTKVESYLNDNKNIALICYCKNESNCHRMIVGNYFREIGFEVCSI